MSESTSSNQSGPPVEAQMSNAYRVDIHHKIDEAWGSNVGDQGYANPYEVAARTYDALYSPGDVEVNMDARARASNPAIADNDLPSRKLWAPTREALVTPLALQGQVPTVEEFVPAVASAILLEADVADTVLPGAREQFVKLIENGDKPAIWSAGYPEHQYRKLGKTGLYSAVDIEGIEPPVEITRQHGEPIEIETAIAGDKTTSEIFARVREIAGSAQIVVVDDRVRNLSKFRVGIPEMKAAIWVQYGSHAKKEMDKLGRGENPQLAEAITNGTIIPIPNIDQLASKIEELRQQGILGAEQTAVFSDYDDTISDNNRRRAMELKAATDTIFARGWV
jgi:hypothetical protein